MMLILTVNDEGWLERAVMIGFVGALLVATKTFYVGHESFRVLTDFDSPTFLARIPWVVGK